MSKIRHQIRHQLGVDYTTLRDLLKQGEWELADNEHRRLLTVLGGEDSEERGWVYFTEARRFPVTDLKTIDNLWTHFSDGRFGFSVQRKLWVGQQAVGQVLQGHRLDGRGEERRLPQVAGGVHLEEGSRPDTCP